MPIEGRLRVAHLGSAERRLRAGRGGHEHDVVDRDPQLLGITQDLGIAFARQLEVPVLTKGVVIRKKPHRVIALLLIGEVVRLAEFHVVGDPHFVLDPLWIWRVLQRWNQVRVAGVVINADQVRLHLLQRREAQHSRHCHEGHRHAKDRNPSPHGCLALFLGRHALFEVARRLGVGLDIERCLSCQRRCCHMGNLAFLLKDSRLTFSKEHRRSPAWNGTTTGLPRPRGQWVP
ncbi:hypothetical protein D9M71_489120 [compost metagenome]